MLTYFFVLSHVPSRLVNNETHCSGVHRRVEQCKRIYDLKNEVDRRCVISSSHLYLESRPKNDCPFFFLLFICAYNVWVISFWFFKYEKNREENQLGFSTYLYLEFF
jgi:hypothetical protein